MLIFRPLFLTGLLLLVGACLLAYGLTMPYYTNQVAADHLLRNLGTLDKKQYYKEEAALRTHKTTLLDVGSGVLVAAAVSLIFLLVKRITHFSDMKKLRTFNSLTVLLLANAAWLLMIPGTWWYYSYRAMRGDYPPFADSIGIPISFQTDFLLTALLPLNILLAIMLIKTKLPTLLLTKPARYNPWIIGWEGFFGLVSLVVGLLLLLFIIDGDHIAIISFCLLCYLLVSLRAGRMRQLNERNPIDL